MSDAAVGILIEHSAYIAVNAGSFYIAAPEYTGASGNYSWKSRGSVNPSAPVQSGAILAPISNVLTSVGDISGGVATLMVNNVVAATSAVNQGTGNYGNYPLYLFRRGGTSLPYNGIFTGLIVRGAASSVAQISLGNGALNAKLGAY